MALRIGAPCIVALLSAACAAGGAAPAVDTTRPTVSSTSPSNGATGVTLGSTISATFSEAMTISTLTSATFTLAPTSGGAAVVGTIAITGNTATLTPLAGLTASTQYTATVTTGAKDAAGNALAANFTWVFNTGNPAPGRLVINEVDYDNIGTDTMEFIEIFNPTNAPVPLAGYSLMLVNGADNTVYNTIDLSPAGTLAAGQYLVVGSSAVIALVPAGQRTIDMGPVSDFIQNGPTDGIALVYATPATLIDALSYEGPVTAVTLPGFAAPVSLVEGTFLPATTADSNTANGSLGRSPSGTDTDNAASDWKFSSAPTPGAANAL
jgi:hypothetical protein